jgi:hypothetical protein
MSEKKSIGMRLAIRKEGRFVNAYAALENTMQGAVLLGSMAAGLCEEDDTIWKRWKALMIDIMAEAVEKMFGERPDMPERPAPEHEKSGEA